MKLSRYILAGVIPLVGCVNPQHAEADEPGLPNIILCMADDQGWGDMGYMGHPVIQTPNFDRMAEEGIRFNRFYSAAPVCSPTRGSVMTGRHPNRFTCFTWGRTLRPQETTLAEVLKDAGYVTGHFGKWHLGSVRIGDPVNPGASGFDEWLSAPNFFDNDPILSREGIAVQMHGESSMVTVDAALEFIHEHEGKDKPYFAVIWFGSPHLPHQAAEEDRDLYPGLPDPLQNFYGEISGMDRAFGKLRSELEKLESYDNTILWFCSDNGGLPDLSRTGGRGYKAQIYEGGLKVPAMIQWPSVFREPATTWVPSSTSDIFPTLLDVVGIEPERNVPLDGISLLPVLLGEESTRSKPMGFWQYPGPGVRTPSAEWMPELLEAQKQGNMVGDSSRLRLDAGSLEITYGTDSLPGHAAWLEWPWKLHRIEDRNGEVSWSLYNLQEDSLENRDLIVEDPARAEEMKQSLEAWQVSVVHSMNGDDY